MNWIDLVILVVVVFFILQGWEEGLAKLTTGLVSFLGSLWLAVYYHTIVGVFLVEKFGLPKSWGDVMGYIVIWFVSGAVISYGTNWLLFRLPKGVMDSKINRFLGAVLSVVKALLIMAFILLFILALPLKGSVKSDVQKSILGNRLVRATEKYGGQIKSELNQTVKRVTQFMTIEPDSGQRIDLSSSIDANISLTVDSVGEQQMLDLVNAERVKIGAKSLTIDTKIVAVSRAHSRDMFERRYFAHVNPDGYNSTYRLEKGGVSFDSMGENLAYSSTVQSAHTGLMNSPGHRDNILNPEFGRVGIGIINGGMYGLMVTQMFAN